MVVRITNCVVVLLVSLSLIKTAQARAELHIEFSFPPRAEIFSLCECRQLDRSGQSMWPCAEVGTLLQSALVELHQVQKIGFLAMVIAILDVSVFGREDNWKRLFTKGAIAVLVILDTMRSFNVIHNLQEAVTATCASNQLQIDYSYTATRVMTLWKVRTYIIASIAAYMAAATVFIKNKPVPLFIYMLYFAAVYNVPYSLNTDSWWEDIDGSGFAGNFLGPRAGCVCTSRECTQPANSLAWMMLAVEGLSLLGSCSSLVHALNAFRGQLVNTGLLWALLLAQIAALVAYAHAVGRTNEACGEAIAPTVWRPMYDATMLGFLYTLVVTSLSKTEPIDEKDPEA
jgi:hypothetical protein